MVDRDTSAELLGCELRCKGNNAVLNALDVEYEREGNGQEYR